MAKGENAHKPVISEKTRFAVLKKTGEIYIGYVGKNTLLQGAFAYLHPRAVSDK